MLAPFRTASGGRRGGRRPPRQWPWWTSWTPTSCCATCACRASAAWTGPGDARTPRRSQVILLSVTTTSSTCSGHAGQTSGYLLRGHQQRRTGPVSSRACRPEGQPSTPGWRRAAETAARLQSDQFWPGARHGLTQREADPLARGHRAVNRGIAAKLVIGERPSRRTSVRSTASSASGTVPVPPQHFTLREGIFR